MDWLAVANRSIYDGDGVTIHLVQDLLYVVTRSPQAFERLPLYAEPLSAPALSPSHLRRCPCCCHEPLDAGAAPRSASHAPEGPTALSPQYLAHSSTMRWLRLSIPTGSFSKAVEELYRALGPELKRAMPVYRRGEALIALRFDEIVADLRRPNRHEMDALKQQFTDLHLQASFPGGRMIVLTSPEALSWGRVREIAVRLRLLNVRYQRVPMRSLNALGSPRRVKGLHLSGRRPRPTLRVSSRSHALLASLTPPTEAPPPAAEQPPFANGGTVGAPADGPWHLQATSTSPPGVSEKLQEVVVAVIDSLCASEHPDLAANLLTSAGNLEFGDARSESYGEVLDPELPAQSHGTACVGVIGALPSPPAWGVAAGVKLLPICVFEWTTANCVDAITRTLLKNPKVRVLSLSLAWYANGEASGPDFAVLAEVLQAVHDQGVLICAATGNVLDPWDEDRTIGFPGCLPFVLAVGAVNQGMRHKEFGDESGEPWAARYDDGCNPAAGSMGGRISVVAPGVSICTTDTTDDGYSFTFNGTSAATPQVAGLAARLFAAYPGVTAKQVRYVIEATADKVGDDSYCWGSAGDSSTRTPRLGYGCIHTEHALTFADVRIHDSSRDPSPIPGASPGPWRSDDVRLTTAGGAADFDKEQGPLANATQFDVFVRVANDGPAAAKGVHAKVWVMEREPTGLLVGEAMQVSEGVLAAAKTAKYASVDANETAELQFEVRLEKPPPAGAFLLIMAIAENDHAFVKSLPACSGDVLPHNNLARVSLTGLFN